MQQVNSQSDREDQDDDVEIGSVQQEDFFNLRQLSVVMSTESKKYGKIGIRIRVLRRMVNFSCFIFDIDDAS